MTKQMEKRNCDGGFHGSLSEDLTNRVCSKCGRNHSNEDFLKACKFFHIDPNSRDQIRSLSDELATEVVPDIEGE